MKRKIFSVLMALVLVCSFSLVTAVPAAAAEIIVGPSESIQEAITAADSGDTIIVSDGTYTEDLVVITPNLTLKSENGSGSTTIQGVDGYVITLESGADGFTLGGTEGAGFKVIGNDTASTVLLETIGGPSGVTLSYNTFDTTGNPSIAIAVGSGGAADLHIIHNTFDLYGSATGVYFDCDPITDLLIDSNIVPGTGNPKWLNFVPDAGVDGAMISNNNVTRGNIVFRMKERTNALNGITITGNTFAESYIAIGPHGTNPNLVTNLTITENSFAASGYYEDYAAFEILGSVGADCINYATVTVARNSFNNFTSSHWAVINGVDGTSLDAQYNHWGDVSGPTHSGNPSGMGGAIREGEEYGDPLVFHPDGDVDYSPWLGEEFGTDPMIWGTNDSIQDAIAEAQPNDTIIVAAGTYSEDIVVNKSLTLKGANAGVPATEVRDPESIIDAGLADYGVLFTGLETIATLDGFTVTNYKICGIRASSFGEDDSLEVHILNNIVETHLSVENTYKYTVIIGFGTTGTVIGNEVSGAPFEDPTWTVLGIHVIGSNDVLISNNYMHDCTFGIHILGYAEYKKDQGYPAAQDNIIESNLIENCKTGITVQWNSIGTIIRDNDVLNNDVGIESVARDWSLEHSTPSGTEIHQNNIVGNELYGVQSFIVGSDSGAVLAEEVDATLNWWDDVSGPEQATTNPDAIGDEVSVKVTYSPWLGDTKGTSPMTFIVDDVGPEPDAGYIQTAVNAANPAGGDTIDVATGEYTETLVIDKQLTLQGAGKTATIIDASGASANGILLEAGGTSASQRLTIKGFTVKNAPSHGIRAYKAGGLDLNYVTFEDLVLTLNTNGMEIHNDVTVSDMEITHCEFVNNEALGLSTASNVIVDGMAITDSKFNGNKYGIYLEGTINGVAILRSEFNNSIGGYGGYMTEAGALTNLTIEDSQFINNVVGLMVWNEDDNADITITSTVFQDNAKWGVMIWGATLTDVLIEDSTVLNNDGLAEGYYGIDFNTYDEVMTNVAVHFTDITGHTVGGGVKNRNTVATAIVDATNNWWGDASGPYHATNPDANGDEVTDNVVYSPWLGATKGTSPMTFVELVTSTDPPEVTLEDEKGAPIATVDISGGDASSGTIGGTSGHPDEPSISLFDGTGKTSVLSLDIKVTGYTSGMALITVPYPDVDPSDGFVDDTDPLVDETTLGLYYWDEAASMWHIAGNNTVDTVDNEVSGYIPVSALTGTPIGMGGYSEGEATVEIGDISVGYSGNDIVDLTIKTNTAELGAVTIELTFDNTVVEVLGGENSDFDSLTVNPNCSVIDNMQTARFVANQLGATGVDATGLDGAVLAQVRLKAVGTTGSLTTLILDVITLKDNDGIAIPYIILPDGTATIGGLGDANSDGAVDVYDCVHIARAVALISDYSVTLAVADVNGDGIVDVWDCTHLARHIAGIVGYEQLGG